MNRVAVVILNWNGRAFLEKFLPSVIQHSSGARIVVADNASTDDSVPLLQQNFPNVELLRIAENGGYSKGYNLALAQIDTEYYVLLNSDIEVTEGWLDPLVRFMDQHPQAAACQPKLRAYHQPDKFEYAGAAGGFIDYLGYPFCRGRLFDDLETDLGQYDTECEVFWASGACMFVRAAHFKEAGGLDEAFFAHMEEIDLCWRLKKRGYTIHCVPGAVVYHVGGGTLNKTSPFKTYLNFRNNLCMVYKNNSSRWLWGLIFFRLCLDGVAGVKFIFTDSFKHTWAVVRAHVYFYKHLKRLQAQRKELKKLGKDSFKAGIMRKCLLWQYFILRRRTYKRLNGIINN